LAARYKKKVDQRFLDDLKHIRDNNLVDPSHWGLFQAQVQKEFDDLDENWERISRKTDYPPLSECGYRKRYMHSIPLRLKQRRQWSDLGSDFRIIFKVNEETKEIYYLGIGKRIKKFPKDINDIWEILKGRKLPEEE
jgi:mRNA-degrading endonuclease RelE of RelBE toxin-antitoxin system